MITAREAIKWHDSIQYIWNLVLLTRLYWKYLSVSVSVNINFTSRFYSFHLTFNFASNSKFKFSFKIIFMTVVLIVLSCFVVQCLYCLPPEIQTFANKMWRIFTSFHHFLFFLYFRILTISFIQHSIFVIISIHVMRRLWWQTALRWYAFIRHRKFNSTFSS